MHKPKVFHDTTQAGKRRAERDLSVAEMQSVICQPDHQVQHRRGEHGGFVYEFSRQAGARRLTVIAEIKKTECWLITGWSE